MNPAVNALMYPDSHNGNSFADGIEFQDFVVEQFNAWGFYIQLYTSKRYQFNKGESVQRAEIKLDNRCTDFQRLSIEVQERTSKSGAWVQSGIYRNDNSVFYIQGNRSVLYLLDKRFLQRWFEHKLKRQYDEKHGTIRTFYMPFETADKYCIAKLTPGLMG